MNIKFINNNTCRIILNQILIILVIATLMITTSYSANIMTITNNYPYAIKVDISVRPYHPSNQSLDTLLEKATTTILSLTIPTGLSKITLPHGDAANKYLKYSVLCTPDDITTTTKTCECNSNTTSQCYFKY